MKELDLIRKYNVAAPRYTSYPTVPFWESDSFASEIWLEKLKSAYAEHSQAGISLYVHLPYCESLCTYCGCNTRITKNHAVEQPYIQTLLKEWQLYTAVLQTEPKVCDLHLGGGTPTFFSPENLAQLIEGLVKTHVDDRKFSFEGHPDNTKVEHLLTLFRLGFKRLSLGIQDFDPKVQFMINRFQTPEQVRAITEKARLIGYDSINYDLIYGLPGQTPLGLSSTIDQVIALRPDRIAFYSYAHVPWIKPGQRHYQDDDIPQDEEKIALYELGKERLLRAGYLDIGMDHFALPNDPLFQAMQERTLHRNFMGYTENVQPILLGLGVSAISEIPDAYAQNTKTVESYIQSIESGNLATVKGHLLSRKDIEIKAHILNLMCKNQTSFSTGIPDDAYARLVELEADGLLTLNNEHISISPLGKSFLRNCCMAIDDRMWTKKTENTIFSKAL